MLRTFRSMGMAVVTTLALASAAVAMPSQTSTGQKPSSPSSSSQKGSTKSHTVSGTLTKIDPSTKMVTITDDKGNPQTMTLASDAKVKQGSHAMSVTDLVSHTGQKVKVSYTESNGQKMAHELDLQGSSSAKSSAKKQGQ